MVNSEEILTLSLQRCLENDAFLDEFYNRFLATNEEIGRFFQNSDLEAQKSMMAKSLLSMISASDENWLNDMHLQRLAVKHKDIGIESRHFLLWEETLLDCVKAFDPQYDETTKQAWQEVISRGKQFMLNGK